MFSGFIYIIIVFYTCRMSAPSTPRDQIHGTPKHPPGEPLRLRPTHNRNFVVVLNSFDKNGSPTRVMPLKSKDLSGAPIIRKFKSKRPHNGSVAVCPQRTPSMFHPSEFHPSDFASHASPLKTAILDDKKRYLPSTPVKERRSLFCETA